MKRVTVDNFLFYLPDLFLFSLKVILRLTWVTHPDYLGDPSDSPGRINWLTWVGRSLFL